MDPRTQERVEQWDSRPFNGGYDGLSDLADADFSGAVTAAGTWLFMLNGRVVGVIDGAIDTFESATGTAYEAPDPALPLLCTMEERGGDTRAKYYTNETPLEEVDETLQDGSFTGYVELSENVLSGDYYAVYYGGRRMAAAYVGNAERLFTGDDAFDRAADEVGIYEVVDVDIDVTDVPETGTDGSSAVDAAAGSGLGSEPGATGAGAGNDLESPTDASTGSEPSTDPTESAVGSIDISDTEPVDAATDERTAESTIENVSFDEAAATADTDADADTAGSTDAATVDADGATETDSDTAPTGTSGDIVSNAVETVTDGADAAESSEPMDDAELTDGTDSTDAPSGITAPDETSVEREPASSGITDATTDVSNAGTTESTPSADDATNGSSPASTRDARAESNAGDTGGRIEPPIGTETATQEPDARAEAEAETDTDAGSTDDAGPDLAEVEAAAEQLEQSDISWTEDDVDAADEESTTVLAGDADVATTSASPESESGTDSKSPVESVEESDDGETEERFQEEAQWRETRSIPSLDPDNSETAAEPSAAPSQPAAAGQRNANAEPKRQRATQQQSQDSRAHVQQSARQRGATDRRDQRTGQAEASPAEPAEAETGSAPEEATAEADERVAELTDRIETLEATRDELAATAEQLEAERDRLRSENEDLSSTIDRLRSRIGELETELERARDATAAEPTPSGTELPRQRALNETNLFVRYDSKSQPTLESAHDGEGDQSAVADNLRLEHHTGFDATDVVVDGQPYETFLTETMEHQFVSWLTQTLLFEIRDTGNADGLGDLYDAIPRIDRAELDATISLADDDTDDVPDEVRFDVVAFDKMGNPLVVANLNDSRVPASQGMLEDVEETASAVKANYPELAAATVVTSSYFEPGALEVTERATGGGFLSRGSKLSYVNLSRKQGYHLCLVESRSEGFHVNVPEL